MTSSANNILYELVDSVSKSIPTMPSTSQPQTSTFEQTVLSYVLKNKPKLYILTPCFASNCFVNYVICLMNTMSLFQKLNFPIQIEFCKNDSLVSRARNNLIAKALHDPTCTHVLFIDNDITWDPIDVLKLVLADKPLCGGVYPLKHYHWDKLVKDPSNPYNTNNVQTMFFFC